MKPGKSHAQLAYILLVILTVSTWQAIAEQPSAGKTTLNYAATIPNAHHPELVYWFWSNDTLRDRRYLQDVRDMAQNSRFDFLMMTDRTTGQGFVFHDVKRMHDIFGEVVKEAHTHGLRVGLQLWAEGYPKLSKEEAVACVSEGEVTLDSSGCADYSAASRWPREGGGDATTGKHEPIASEPLVAFAFRKTADGVYDPGSLVELPASALTVTRSDATSVKVRIDGTAKLAGHTAYVLVAHYLQFPDLFNEVMTSHLTGTLRQYHDIPFDGTALDEFGWMMVKQKQPDQSPFRDRFYGKSFAKEFKRLKGRSLETELFHMRYAPAGDTSPRIRAINDYFDVMRLGPLRVDQAFHDVSRELFGPNTFAGIHNTFHNSLECDEVWRTGVNWWRIPRAYGQSDENISFPVRMGLLVNSTEAVMYDQFYTPVLARYTNKVMAEARYNVRTHYHAWNDKGRWGRDMGDADVLAAINPLEEKIRLLNQFDPAPPKLPLLIVFGMPAQLNWFPNSSARNNWDIHTLGIEKKAVSVWNAGYPCALVSSDLIDDGKISVDAMRRPVVNGHTFAAMVYLYPQYSTAKALAFLERFANAGGKLMLEGEATRDFTGADMTRRFAAVSAKATVRGFDVGKIPALGVAKPGNPDATELEDGSVVCSDLSSFTSGNPKAFDIRLNGHTWSGNYVGVFALKSNPAAAIEKLASGGFSRLLCDGKQVLSIDKPTDIVLRREKDGNYHVWIKGSPETHHLSWK